jgi:hypothetical protein
MNREFPGLSTFHWNGKPFHQNQRRRNMKRNVIRNSFIAGTAAVALIAAGSLAAPNEAQAKNGKYLGALAVGAFIGAGLASHGYYGGPAYGSVKLLEMSMRRFQFFRFEKNRQLE